MIAWGPGQPNFLVDDFLVRVPAANDHIYTSDGADDQVTEVSV